MKIPWSEKVGVISINPDAASRHDIARLAGELMEANNRIEAAIDALECDKKYENMSIAAIHILKGAIK